MSEKKTIVRKLEEDGIQKVLFTNCKVNINNTVRTKVSREGNGQGVSFVRSKHLRQNKSKTWGLSWRFLAELIIKLSQMMIQDEWMGELLLSQMMILMQGVVVVINHDTDGE